MSCPPTKFLENNRVSFYSTFSPLRRRMYSLLFTSYSHPENRSKNRLFSHFFTRLRFAAEHAPDHLKHRSRERIRTDEGVDAMHHALCVYDSPTFPENPA